MDFTCSSNLVKGEPHLFLDRDGTLIKEYNYLRDPDKVVLEDGVIEGLRLFIKNGYRLVVISNQSGIARSLITDSELDSITSKINKILAQEFISIGSWHYCPHLPTQGCSCRKPSTGLFLNANTLCPVDWANSVMVGDKCSDVQAGLALGLLSVLVTTGYGLRYVTWAQHEGIMVVHSLLDLANLLFNYNDSKTPQNS